MSNDPDKTTDREQTTDCMWCRYGDHLDGPFCPRHGGPKVDQLRAALRLIELEAAELDAREVARQALRDV